MILQIQLPSFTIDWLEWVYVNKHIEVGSIHPHCDPLTVVGNIIKKYFLKYIKILWLSCFLNMISEKKGGLSSQNFIHTTHAFVCVVRDFIYMVHIRPLDPATCYLEHMYLLPYRNIHMVSGLAQPFMLVYPYAFHP